MVSLKKKVNYATKQTNRFTKITNATCDQCKINDELATTTFLATLAAQKVTLLSYLAVGQVVDLLADVCDVRFGLIESGTAGNIAVGFGET